MKYLLDTHIALWVLENNPRLPLGIRELLTRNGNQVFYSVASVWEIAIKHMARPDRMLMSGRAFSDACTSSGFIPVPITENHVHMIETLSRPEDAPPHHDPFDRILIAQAKADKMTLLTHDSLLPYYGENCVYFVK